MLLPLGPEFEEVRRSPETLEKVQNRTRFRLENQDDNCTRVYSSR